MVVSGRQSEHPRTFIRGAGLIGLSIAWELIRRGVQPVILDYSRVQERASWAAAGMLSAQFEALIEPEVSSDLRQFASRSARLWPEFARELESTSGLAVHYRSGPTLGLLDADYLVRFEEGNRLAGIDANPDPYAYQSLVPGLKPDRFRPILFHEDGQVDNRAVLNALLTVCAPYLQTDLMPDRQDDLVIECRGWQADMVRPVKGQMVSLRPHPSHPKIPVRWGAAYIVPKPDRTIIGASVEPDVTDLETDESVIEALLENAFSLFPEMARSFEISERWSGLRPMARRQRPVIGWQEPGRRYLATGHYRNGILLAPATAELVVNDLLGVAPEYTFSLSDLRP